MACARPDNSGLLKANRAPDPAHGISRLIRQLSQDQQPSRILSGTRNRDFRRLGRRTHTIVSELAADLRLLKAARMIDGSTPSPKALALSKRLL
ncbi:MAG: hypothetical protein LBR80_06595, partial [Deltaproteobacteria bacterium]|nr:hypothetical protein [Deltaproteobacteria bacterium]